MVFALTKEPPTPLMTKFLAEGVSLLKLDYCTLKSQIDILFSYTTKEYAAKTNSTLVVTNISNKENDSFHPTGPVPHRKFYLIKLLCWPCTHLCRRQFPHLGQPFLMHSSRSVGQK